MFNKATKQLWFGELRTVRGNTVVIYDGRLPEASPGRLYFYHSGRDAIIEFVEDIVKPNLYELDDAQTQAAKDSYLHAWEKSRQAFVAANLSRFDASDIPDSGPAPKPKAKPDEEAEPVAEVEDYVDTDDDEKDEDFDDMGDNLDDMD
ncbi:hypothetical protein ACFOD0_09595 [Shewanella intestini]|uniref:Uncharacterized protein n=1 Tax=Shewanella intestini TaxID=2017544 RepID=A0ABS5I3W9_9GAMM|nr:MULTISPECIES: hypothetical protein [Shewanella]MBR9728717.1 hypothetical protein [Shewanella intestini]MRG36793.1 hypothetical protein [Shewanella sp. XMDDZSB0408]